MENLSRLWWAEGSSNVETTGWQQTMHLRGSNMALGVKLPFFSSTQRLCTHDRKLLSEHPGNPFFLDPSPPPPYKTIGVYRM